jgi:phage/plasmid-associated DNA primase
MSERNPDHVSLFLDECTLGGLEETEAVPAADLYGMYIIWCENGGLVPASVLLQCRPGSRRTGSAAAFRTRL